MNREAGEVVEMMEERELLVERPTVPKFSGADVVDGKDEGLTETLLAVVNVDIDVISDVGVEVVKREKNVKILEGEMIAEDARVLKVERIDSVELVLCGT